MKVYRHPPPPFHPIKSVRILLFICVIMPFFISKCKTNLNTIRSSSNFVEDLSVQLSNLYRYIKDSIDLCLTEFMSRRQNIWQKLILMKLNRIHIGLSWTYVSIQLFHDKNNFKNWLTHLSVLTWYQVSMLQLLKSNTCIYSIYQRFIGLQW